MVSAQAEPFTSHVTAVCDTLDKMFEYFKSRKQIPIMTADAPDEPDIRMTFWMSENRDITFTASNKTAMCIIGEGERVQTVPGAQEILGKWSTKRRL